MRLTVGVENAFDRDVPFVVYRNDYNSFENDLRGRYIYATAQSGLLVTKNGKPSIAVRLGSDLEKRGHHE